MSWSNGINLDQVLAKVRTGANKGLGYESARRLIESGHTVYIGARDSDRGEKAAAELGARFVQLDVSDDANFTHEGSRVLPGCEAPP